MWYRHSDAQRSYAAMRGNTWSEEEEEASSVMHSTQYCVLGVRASSSCAATHSTELACSTQYCTQLRSSCSVRTVGHLADRGVPAQQVRTEDAQHTHPSS